nr:energy transducer TonB [Saprospiraceae bacterium]
TFLDCEIFRKYYYLIFDSQSADNEYLKNQHINFTEALHKYIINSTGKAINVLTKSYYPHMGNLTYLNDAKYSYTIYLFDPKNGPNYPLELSNKLASFEFEFKNNEVNLLNFDENKEKVYEFINNITDGSLPPPPPPPPPPPKEEIFKIVEQMPRFPGCENMEGTDQEKYKCSREKLMQYIKDNLKYPEPEKNNGVGGTVLVSFVINKEGKIENITVLRSPSSGLEKAAIEVIELMKELDEPWTVGKQRGRPVKVSYTVPIKFKL